MKNGRACLWVFFLLLTFLFSMNVLANDTFDPSRVRLLMHGHHDFQNDTQLRIHFIPAGNLLGEVAPLAYLGYGFKLAKWLDVEPTVGWTFGNDEPIVSLRLVPNASDLWAWLDLELQPKTKNHYWFAQVDYKFFDWLHAGFEGEGWGDLEKSETISYGGGPNLLFRMDKVGFDFAVHGRRLNDSFKPEFVLRCHLFL